MESIRKFTYNGLSVIINKFKFWKAKTKAKFARYLGSPFKIREEILFENPEKGISKKLVIWTDVSAYGGPKGTSVKRYQKFYSTSVSVIE